MVKETKTEKTIVFFVTVLSLVVFQLGEGGLPPSFAYDPNEIEQHHSEFVFPPLSCKSVKIRSRVQPKAKKDKFKLRRG